MKNIYILMTDKPTWFHKSILTGILRKSSSCINDMKQAYGVNIHITSDEKFVKDDYITDGIEVIRATPKLVDAQGLVNRRDWKKIILSTDEELIKDGVQAIDDEFIEWFVKNPSCEEVYVKDIRTIPALQLGSPNGHLMYEIIIPKEEPKQETLEEAAENLYPKDIRTHYSMYQEEIFDNNSPERNAFIEGAKWQQERMYSEEELLNFADFYHKYKELIKAEKWEIIEMSKEEVFKKWFEQFKNK